MVEFYEYIFYRMYWFDVKKTRKFTPKEGVLSASITMSLLEGLNFIFAAESINYLFNPNYKTCDIPYVFPALVFTALNFCYFSRKGRKDEIVNYWEKQATKEERFNMDVKLITYIILSFASTTWLVGWVL